MNLLLLAQDAAPLAPPSDAKQYVLYLLAAAVLPLLVGELREWRKWKAEQKAAREKAVSEAAWSAYNVVEDQRGPSRTKLLSKAALAEQHFVELLGTTGIQPSSAERNRARKIWAAMHGEARARR